MFTNGPSGASVWSANNLTAQGQQPQAPNMTGSHPHTGAQVVWMPTQIVLEPHVVGAPGNAQPHPFAPSSFMPYAYHGFQTQIEHGPERPLMNWTVQQGHFRSDINIRQNARPQQSSSFIANNTMRHRANDPRSQINNNSGSHKDASSFVPLHQRTMNLGNDIKAGSKIKKDDLEALCIAHATDLMHKDGVVAFYPKGAKAMFAAIIGDPPFPDNNGKLLELVHAWAAALPPELVEEDFHAQFVDAVSTALRKCAKEITSVGTELFNVGLHTGRNAQSQSTLRAELFHQALAKVRDNRNASHQEIVRSLAKEKGLPIDQLIATQALRADFEATLSWTAEGKIGDSPLFSPVVRQKIADFLGTNTFEPQSIGDVVDKEALFAKIQADTSQNRVVQMHRLIKEELTKAAPFVDACVDSIMAASDLALLQGKEKERAFWRKLVALATPLQSSVDTDEDI